jgi:hypothetical protein
LPPFPGGQAKNLKLKAKNCFLPDSDVARFGFLSARLNPKNHGLEEKEEQTEQKLCAP